MVVVCFLFFLFIVVDFIFFLLLYNGEWEDNMFSLYVFGLRGFIFGYDWIIVEYYMDILDFE